MDRSSSSGCRTTRPCESESPVFWGRHRIGRCLDWFRLSIPRFGVSMKMWLEFSAKWGALVAADTRNQGLRRGVSRTSHGCRGFLGTSNQAAPLLLLHGSDVGLTCLTWSSPVFSEYNSFCFSAAEVHCEVSGDVPSSTGPKPDQQWFGNFRVVLADDTPVLQVCVCVCVFFFDSPVPRGCWVFFFGLPKQCRQGTDQKFVWVMFLSWNGMCFVLIEFGPLQVNLWCHVPC